MSDFGSMLKHFAQRLYEIQFINMPNSTKNSAVDRDARIISDFLGTGKQVVTHNTYFMIKHCDMWSEKAIEKYLSLEGSHAWRCSSRRVGRLFTVEHEFPLGILKRMIRERQFGSAEQILNYMSKYGKPCIVTVEEDDLLRVQQRTAETLQEAVERYNNADIKIRQFTERVD